MIDNFNSGYVKCLVDIRQQLQDIKEYFPRSKIRQLNMITSLVSYLLAHKDKRDLYRDTGGHGIWIKIDPEGRVMHIAEKKNDLGADDCETETILRERR